MVLEKRKWVLHPFWREKEQQRSTRMKRETNGKEKTKVNTLYAKRVKVMRETNKQKGKELRNRVTGKEKLPVEVNQEGRPKA